LAQIFPKWTNKAPLYSAVGAGLRIEITNSLASRSNQFSWLEWDDTEMQGKFLNYPEREEIPENINEQLIVELYSK